MDAKKDYEEALERQERQWEAIDERSISHWAAVGRGAFIIWVMAFVAVWWPGLSSGSRFFYLRAIIGVGPLCLLVFIPFWAGPSEAIAKRLRPDERDRTIRSLREQLFLEKWSHGRRDF